MPHSPLPRTWVMPSCLAKPDGQRRPPPQHPGVPPATVARERRLGMTFEEGSQTHLALGSGQCGAKTEVPTAGEGEVPARVVPGDVEAVRVGKHGGVTVGAGE